MDYYSQVDRGLHVSLRVISESIEILAEQVQFNGLGCLATAKPSLWQLHWK